MSLIRLYLVGIAVLFCTNIIAMNQTIVRNKPEMVPLLREHFKLLCFEDVQSETARKRTGEVYNQWTVIENVARELKMQELSVTNPRAAFLALTDIAHWAVTKKQETAHYAEDAKKLCELFLEDRPVFCIRTSDESLGLTMAPEVADFIPFLSAGRRFNQFKLVMSCTNSSLIVLHQLAYLLYHYNKQYEYSKWGQLECRYSLQPAFEENNEQLIESLVRLLEYINTFDHLSMVDLMECAQLYELPVLAQSLVRFIQKNRPNDAINCFTTIPFAYLLARFIKNVKNAPFLFKIILVRLHEIEESQREGAIQIASSYIATALPLLFKKVNFLNKYVPKFSYGEIDYWTKNQQFDPQRAFIELFFSPEHIERIKKFTHSPTELSQEETIQEEYQKPLVNVFHGLLVSFYDNPPLEALKNKVITLVRDRFLELHQLPMPAFSKFFGDPRDRGATHVRILSNHRVLFINNIFKFWAIYNDMTAHRICSRIAGDGWPRRCLVTALEEPLVACVQNCDEVEIIDTTQGQVVETSFTVPDIVALDSWAAKTFVVAKKKTIEMVDRESHKGIPLACATDETAHIDGLRVDGPVIIAWYSNGTVKVWDAATRRFLNYFKSPCTSTTSRELYLDESFGHNRPLTHVTACAFIPGRTLLCGYYDGTVCQWDIKSGRLCSKFFLPEEKEYAQCFYYMPKPGAHIIGCSNGNIRMNSKSLRGVKLGNDDRIPLTIWPTVTEGFFNVYNSDQSLEQWSIYDFLPSLNTLREWLNERSQL